ncbi:Hypothetical protein PFCIRM516_06555 [Propionibacterium freudenreichii]|uniref:hypothetical protein n=1 Tax=Propionibacterium freudenreichii TaxID=1744 RepID=UPI0005A5C564|nr:hypothetical protein [Propionibacterium freudenreichii]CEI26473.1 Hypothetical protein PFCIRM516_06555 [Propionibacterium freudenreichii]
MSSSAYSTALPKGHARKERAGVRQRKRLAYTVMEASWLLGCGVGFCQVAAQLDMSPNSLQRALYKAKRPDLAVQCHADAWGLR